MPRDLEVWAVSDDGEYVLLAGSEDAPRSTHQLRIDARLEAAVRGDLEDDDEDRRESELSPKEIQARLRAGDTIEEVAKAARVALPRIERYAGPVISERDRIVDQARATVVHRARGPEGEVPLGRMVERRLVEAVGLRPETVVWSTRRRDDGAWIVALSYTAKGGSRTAQWLWQPSGRELTSLNPLGTRLGVDDGVTVKRKRPAVVVPAAPTRTPAAPARPVVKRAPAPKPAAKKAAPKKVAKKAVPKKAVPKKATKKAAPKKAAPRAVAKKATPTRAVKKAAVRKAAPKKAIKKAAVRKAPVAVVKPRINKALEAKRAQRRAAPRKAARVVAAPITRADGRAAVPSWDDVLLGVRSPAAARGRRRS